MFESCIIYPPECSAAGRSVAVCLVKRMVGAAAKTAEASGDDGSAGQASQDGCTSVEGTQGDLEGEQGIRMHRGPERGFALASEDRETRWEAAVGEEVPSASVCPPPPSVSDQPYKEIFFNSR